MNQVAVRIVKRGGGYLVIPRLDKPKWFADFNEAWEWSVWYFGGRTPSRT